MSRLVHWLTRQDRSVYLLALMVALAMMLGGGGSPAPLVEMGLQVVLAMLMVLWFWIVPRGTLGAGAPLAWGLAGLIMMVPLVQLIPLPPGLWHGLPGRGDEKAALDLVGLGESWRPLSVAPYRTLASWLVMVPPALLIPLIAVQTMRARMVVLITVVAVALLSLLVGAGQLLGGMWSILRPYSPDSWWLDGFQANHNAQADVLLIAMLAATAVLAECAQRGAIRRRYALFGPVGMISAGFVFGIALTGSRAGIALVPVAWIGQGLLLRPWLTLSRRLKVMGLGAVALIGLGGTALAMSNGVLNGVAQRFSVVDPMRPLIWDNTWYAVRQHWPWGTGMGTFQPMYDATETLETITEWSINRAHNEYLEFALEAGLPGLVVALLSGAALVWRTLQPVGRDHEVSRIFSHGAKVGLVILLLHSFVDYPFRSMSLACLAGVLAGMLFPARGERAPVEQMKVGL